MTQTPHHDPVPPAVPPGAELPDWAEYAAQPAPATAPALDPPRWSGRKTAIAAALAIGISSMGAVGAAAALPSGTAGAGNGQFSRGGFGPGGQQGPRGIGQPGGQQQGGQQQGNQQQPGIPQVRPGQPPSGGSGWGT